MEKKNYEAPAIKKVKAELQIKEAIRYYNLHRAEGVPEMTAADLALEVFKDKKSKDICKVKLFYGIINNHRRFVDLNWLIIISEKTGYPKRLLIRYI
ncbi:MAG: hypothetical protein MUO72_09675 [Bacteroidales bacterium]|nr:hypothetical protein [Bacteroidales bacterium]